MNQNFNFAISKDINTEVALEQLAEKINAAMQQGWHPYGEVIKEHETSPNTLAPLRIFAMGMIYVGSEDTL